MQAAFVDIGLEKAGFLHVSDFLDEVGAFGALAREMEEGEVETEPVNGGGADSDLHSDPIPIEDLSDDSADEPQEDAAEKPRRRTARRSRLPIEQQLRRNQEIIVQIAKEPIGTKGAR